MWFCFAVLLLALLPERADGQTAHTSPNVIFIVTDDLNRRISILGDPDAITPNLERLALKSVNFTNAMCQNPLCAPSRASFLSGIYPWDIGIRKGGASVTTDKVIPNRQLIHEYFRSNGYWVGGYGKVEQSLDASKWDDSLPSQGDGSFSPEDLVSTQNFNGYSNLSGATFTVYNSDKDLFGDGVVTTTALAAIDSRVTAGGPFFIAIGLKNPHGPQVVPKEHADLYDPATLTLPSDPEGSFGLWPNYFFPSGRNDPDPIMSDATKQDLLHSYYSSVTLMDYQLGRILDKIDEHSLWDNTIVVFISDNGLNLGEHRIMFAKKRITRESVSIPFLVHAPGMTTENTTCSRQVGLIDLFPTLVDLAGLPDFPKPLAGTSISPLIEDPTAPWDVVQYAVTTNTGGTDGRVFGRIAQLGPYKLVEGVKASLTSWIINHDLDPFELFPNSSSVGAGGIDQATYNQLFASLNAEIPWGFLHYSSTALPPYDRDNDGISDEDEINLSFLGLRPFQNNSETINNLEAKVDVSTNPDNSMSVTATLQVPLTEPLDSDWQPPVVLKAFNGSSWDVVDGGDPLDLGGFFGWNFDVPASSEAELFKVVLGE